ncbi:MAG: hypothetical protein ACXWVD_15165, partial [Telluria sp.]
LGGAVAGGVPRRYLRQLGASVLLGLMFMGAISVRWLLDDPVRGAASLAGIGALAALASLFGRCSRTPRLFLALFLFGVYVAVQVKGVPMLDPVGFSGAATAGSMAAFLCTGVAAAVAGYWWNRRT